MRAGFVMLSSDEPPLLEHSLAAAMAAGFDDGMVIDNGSTDGTAEIARRHDVALLTLERRLPYNVAMNVALRRMWTDAIALLQADTFIAPGYRAACLEALAEPGVGSVAPKLLRTSGPLMQDRLPIVDAAGMSVDRRRKNSLVGHGQPDRSYSTTAEAFGADGAAAVYRREALDDCAIDHEVFDENMPGWACDADLAWRARLLGWGSRYEPRAVVHHIRTYSPTTRAHTGARDRRTQFRNRYLMILKNDSLSDLVRDTGPLLRYELLALGYALLREPWLLGGYVEAAARLPGALRRRRLIQSRRRVRRVPFGMEPPA